MDKHCTHWINGKPWTLDSATRGDIYNPATGQVSGTVDFGGAAEVGAAVAAAAAALPGWRETSLVRRADVMFRFRELITRHARDVAALITAEHGKVLSDAMGEVARGLEVVEFACGIPHLLKGGFSENVSTGVDAYSIRQPVGVVAGITPFNFPAMVPMWMYPIALACGNTFVLKPSEKDPSRVGADGPAAGRRRAAGRRVQRRAWRQGGGRRAAHPSRRQGRELRRLDADRPLRRPRPRTEHGKRVQALGGAKNHMMVLPDADLDLAADAAVNAGFGSAGERCMAISVVVAVDPIGDELVGEDRRAGRRAAGRPRLRTRSRRWAPW